MIDLEKLEESPHLIDILIQMEDVLDSLDIYVFPNWFSGRILSGPIVKRYWLAMSLEYDYDKKPDEKAALRLLKHKVQVKIRKGKRGERTTTTGSKEEQENSNSVWIVDISIPKRLITVLQSNQLDFYQDEVDIDDVQDASDAGMNAETGYVDDEVNQDMANNTDDMPTDEESNG